MKEKTDEAAFRKWCKLRGWMCLKLKLVAGRGFPDRTILMSGGRVVFIEFKTPNGEISPHQHWWIGVLEKLGFPITVVASDEEAKQFCLSLLSRN
jgi:hypothetical protein